MKHRLTKHTKKQNKFDANLGGLMPVPQRAECDAIINAWYKRALYAKLRSSTVLSQPKLSDHITHVGNDLISLL